MTQEAESTGTVPVTAHSKTAQAAQPYETASNGVTPKPPVFEDKYKEREYQKGRLALAFRIFAKLGFDEGIAGHITLRVSLLFLKLLKAILEYYTLTENVVY